MEIYLIFVRSGVDYIEFSVSLLFWFNPHCIETKEMVWRVLDWHENWWCGYLIRLFERLVCWLVCVCMCLIVKTSTCGWWFPCLFAWGSNRHGRDYNKWGLGTGLGTTTNTTPVGSSPGHFFKKIHGGIHFSKKESGYWLLPHSYLASFNQLAL